MRALFAGILALTIHFSTQAQLDFQDSLITERIYAEAVRNPKSASMLEYMCNTIGPRLSGSNNAQIAVNWTAAMMNKWGFDTVYLQEVMVPHWVRGDREVAYIVDRGILTYVKICALGGSIGTSSSGIDAPIVEVHNFEELARLGTDRVQGKIVFFNRAMDSTLSNTFEAYSKAVNQRGRGAIEAAKYGAIGVVVRSMTTRIDEYPHTGAMHYDSAYTKIPACAISTKDAEALSQRIKVNPELLFHLNLNCETLPDERSYNVIGEIKGIEMPNEYVVVGGHLDSWDLATGAHDDGAGCVQAIEAGRLLKSMGYRPKRTIRVVMFMNEENGLRGGMEYLRQAKIRQEKHIAAIESDAGGFLPLGFGIEGTIADDKLDVIKQAFYPHDILSFGAGHGGADIGPLRETGTVLFGLSPESKHYFDFHHCALDTYENVNKEELEKGAAAMAVLLYFLAEYGI